MQRRRPIDRVAGHVRDSILIVIASEDTYAVHQYFDFFQSTKIQFVVLDTEEGRSAPQHILDRLDAYRQEFEIGPDDEFWLVSDCDHWITPGHIHNLSLVVSQCRQKGINVALSHPCFELWLLLHFADCPTSPALTCDDLHAMIRDAAGSYDKKKVYRLLINQDRVNQAITRAATACGCEPGNIPTAPATAVHAIIADLVRRNVIAVPGT